MTLLYALVAVYIHSTTGQVDRVVVAEGYPKEKCMERATFHAQAAADGGYRGYVVCHSMKKLPSPSDPLPSVELDNGSILVIPRPSARLVAQETVIRPGVQAGGAPGAASRE